MATHQLLGQLTRHISVEDTVFLENSVFPYPPFGWYELKCPVGVDEKVIDKSSEDVGEGGSRFFTSVFSFSQKGTYTFHVKVLKQPATRVITIIVE